MNKKVSVIIPTYNVEKYVKRCITSVINQTYKDLEIIIVDDGSTDGTIEVIHELANCNLNIKIITKKNSGVSDSRNIGIDAADGSFICFFDSDDYIDENFLSDAVRIMETNNVDLFNAGFYSEVDTGNKRYRDIFQCEEKLYDSKEKIKEDLVQLWDKSMLYNIWNKLYRADIIKNYNIKFKAQKYGEDVEFNKQYLRHTKSMYNTKKCYYHYIREREGASTNKYVDDFFSFREQEYEEFNNYFESVGINREDYIEFSSRRFVERTIGCLESIYEDNCPLNFKEKYVYTKKILNNVNVQQSCKLMIPTSKKMKVLLIPIKLKYTIIEMLISKLISIVKHNCSAFFNKLKNKR